MNVRHRRNNRLWEGWGSSEGGVAHLEVRGARCEAKVKKDYNDEASGVGAK